MDCKVFQMMPYRITLKVRTFCQPTANRFSTAGQKPVGGGGGGGGGHSVCDSLGYCGL